MKIKWLGHACFKLTCSGGECVVTDPFDPSVGYGELNETADILTVSHGHHDHCFTEGVKRAKLTVVRAGEYVCGGVKITALPCFHDDCKGAKRGSNLIVKIQADGQTAVHLGDLGHMPDKAQLEFIKGADALLIPIGGFYTIDTKTALEIIDLARPRSAVAMHFSNDFCRFPISSAEEFIKSSGARIIKGEADISSLPPYAVFDFQAE